MPERRLNAVELDKIQKAIAAGLPLANRQHAAPMVERCEFEPFDALFSPDRQDAFIREGARHGRTRAERIEAIALSATPAERESWEWFQGLPKANRMLEAAGTVIHAAIPEPEDFMNSYWKFSFGRALQKNTSRTILSISCGLWAVFTCRMLRLFPEAVTCTLTLAGFMAGLRNEHGPILPRRHRYAQWELGDPIGPKRTAESFAPMREWRYASEADRLADIDRDVTQAAMTAPYEATCALEHVGLLLEDPDVVRALQAQAMACMRMTPLMNLESSNRIGAAAAMMAV